MNMGFTEKDIQTLYAAFGRLAERVEELEAQLAQLQGKKKCVIIEMKPRKTS